MLEEAGKKSALGSLEDNDPEGEEEEKDVEEESEEDELGDDDYIDRWKEGRFRRK